MRAEANRKRVAEAPAASLVALRARKFRARRALGKVVLKIEVDLVDHTEMLIASGVLKDDEDRSEIEAATELLLRTLAAETRNAAID